MLLGGMSGLSSQARAAAPCDRACLDGFIDRYLTALVARDASRIPVTRTVKFTENGQRLALGDGLWNTITGLGKYKLYFADPEAGQAGYFGTYQEYGGPGVIALRLKIENGSISEIETLVARNEVGGAHAESGAKWLEEMGKPRAALTAATPPGERLSREELVKIANMYFTGLERNDGKGIYPFSDDCNRIENGEFTTNNKPKGSIFAVGCKAQFDAGFFRFVTRIRDRRFLLVDRERSLVMAFAFFDHAGNYRVKRPDGTEGPMGPARPFTWEIAELFKIENRKLSQIEAVLDQCPYGMTSGWSPWEDAISSKPQYTPPPK